MSYGCSSQWRVFVILWRVLYTRILRHSGADLPGTLPYLSYFGPVCSSSFSGQIKVSSVEEFQTLIWWFTSLTVITVPNCLYFEDVLIHSDMMWAADYCHTPPDASNYVMGQSIYFRWWAGCVQSGRRIERCGETVSCPDGRSQMVKPHGGNTSKHTLVWCNSAGWYQVKYLKEEAAGQMHRWE